MIVFLVLLNMSASLLTVFLDFFNSCLAACLGIREHFIKITVTLSSLINHYTGLSERFSLCLRNMRRYQSCFQEMLSLKSLVFYQRKYKVIDR